MRRSARPSLDPQVGQVGACQSLHQRVVTQKSSLLPTAAAAAAAEPLLGGILPVAWLVTSR